MVAARAARVEVPRSRPKQLPQPHQPRGLTLDDRTKARAFTTISPMPMKRCGSDAQAFTLAEHSQDVVGETLLPFGGKVREAGQIVFGN